MATEQVFDFTTDELHEVYLTFRGKASDTLAKLATARYEGLTQLETILMSEYELYNGIADKTRRNFTKGN
jgi:hypothetical protein